MPSAVIFLTSPVIQNAEVIEAPGEHEGTSRRWNVDK